ncbi:MAG: hypothetical protein WB424_03620 [Terracidiphilus sp.]
MAEQKRFERLKADDPLVTELASGKYPWWNTLVALSHTEKDINIQVRGRYLNVYFKMGNLLRVGMAGRKLVCQTHYKYLIGSHSPEYVDVTPTGNDLAVSLESCKLVNSILEEKNFKRIKSNIAALAGEEKRFQSKLVENNRKTLLDAEIAFNDSGTEIDPEEDNAPNRCDTRIDLVNYDKNRNMLVFIELKQVFDDRLYSDTKGFKEVNEQIAKYTAFAKNHEKEILRAYNNVIEVKGVLGLLPDDSALKSVTIEYVQPKPILAIAAYDQDIILAKRDKVRKDLKTEDLAALYFFGSTVDLNLTAKGGNKELFI